MRTSSRFLRRALAANAAFSGLSGVVLLVGASPLAAPLGIHEPPLLIGLAVSLLVYAAGLLRSARRPSINRTEVWIAVILDAGWVAGSAVVIFAGVLSRTGNWVVAVVADIVLLFGILQFYGLRRMTTVP